MIKPTKDFRLSKEAKRMLALMHPVDTDKRALWKASHIEAEVAKAKAKMAIRITPLDYANTFADWMSTTNSTLAETNDIGANNYTKSNGTFFITSSGTGISVSNNALVSGTLTTGNTVVVRNAGDFTGKTITATTFSGSLQNTLTLNTSGTGLSGSTSFNNSGSATFTVTSNATSAGTTANTIVSRGTNGDFTAGNITGTSFIKSGGTSTQFLKADGSSDSTSYVTFASGTTLLVNSVTANTCVDPIGPDASIRYCPSTVKSSPSNNL